ncbi:hypothetical protein ACWD4F_39790 [Streptomyces aureus]
MLASPQADYEEDRPVPLGLGGAPRDRGNLWPEQYSGTKTASQPLESGLAVVRHQKL